METNIIVSFFVGLVFIIILGKIFLFPIKKIFKFITNSCLGAVAIYFINVIGTTFGFHIGLNVISSIIIGVLGIPGAILLILFKIFCT